MIAYFALFAIIAISSSEARIDVCRMKPDPGPCLAYFPSWGMNPETGRCEEFIYGGCQGNANRFDTREQCERACGHVGMY